LLEGQAPQAVDSARLIRDLWVLAHDSMQGRAPGTSGSLRARAFLERELATAGARPPAGGFAQPFEWPEGRGVNLIGIVPGRGDGNEVIVLSAHYDHVGVREGQIYNGADDNASGAVALLEIMRDIVADPLRHTLVVALLDAEEQGSRGAAAFVASPTVPIDRIALNVNLDMVARTDGVLWAGGAYHTPALRPILERVAARAPLTLRLGHDRPGAPEGDDWTNQSDHGEFHAAGIPFVYFGVEDHPDYHRPTDDVERVDPGEYVASVRTILLGLRALDAALPLAPDAPR
jgi:Zn-dependent M28 family amino/carboxypeptidase